MEKKKNRWAQELARMRAKSLSRERRVEIAKAAAAARWGRAAEKEKKNLPCP